MPHASNMQSAPQVDPETARRTFLAILDGTYGDDPELIGEYTAFVVDFFRDLPRDRDTFFVESDTPVTSALRWYE